MVGIGTTMVVEGGVVVVVPPLEDCPLELPCVFGAVEVAGEGASVGRDVAVGEGVASGTADGSRDGCWVTACESEVPPEVPAGCSNQSSPMAAETAHPLSPTPSTTAAVTHANHAFELFGSATSRRPFGLNHEL